MFALSENGPQLFPRVVVHAAPVAVVVGVGVLVSVGVGVGVVAVGVGVAELADGDGLGDDEGTLAAQDTGYAPDGHGVGPVSLTFTSRCMLFTHPYKVPGTPVSAADPCPGTSSTTSPPAMTTASAAVTHRNLRIRILPRAWNREGRPGERGRARSRPPRGLSWVTS
jgi:hypothetical protein